MLKRNYQTDIIVANCFIGAKKKPESEYIEYALEDGVYECEYELSSLVLFL